MARPQSGLSKALNSLVLRGKVITGRLSVPNSRPAIPAGFGVGTPTTATGTGGGGGIASPITEKNDSRIFYDHDLVSSDGLFVMEDLVSQKITTRDAAGSEVIFNYDNPYTRSCPIMRLVFHITVYLLMED